MTRKKILIVEDNTDLATILSLHLSDMDFDVKHVADGHKGIALLQNESFDLVILDLMLPGIDGLEICRRIRNQNHYTPVLMLTSKSSEFDRVLGLEIGADDYVTKPFSIREVIARIKALFRHAEAFSRTGSASAEEKNSVAYGGLEVDTETHRVTIDGRAVDLTAREFELLHHFIKRPGRVYSRAQLLDLVWGYGHEGYEHTVNSHINRLRAKIEQNPAKPEYILTIWGVGYKFNDVLNRQG